MTAHLSLVDVADNKRVNFLVYMLVIFVVYFSFFFSFSTGRGRYHSLLFFSLLVKDALEVMLSGASNFVRFPLESYTL